MSKYQHYKGGIYTLIDPSVLHTETGEFLVIYKTSKGATYARPKDMFFNNVLVDGENVPRFKELKDAKNTKARKSNPRGVLSRWIAGIRNL